MSHDYTIMAHFYYISKHSILFIIKFVINTNTK